jgi:Na+:H+ antiporter, NhaA family
MWGMSSGGDFRAPGHFHRPWVRSQRPVPRLVVRPLERFLNLEAGSASLLLAAAAVALVWANLSEGSYTDFWETLLRLELGPLELEEDLRHIVNDLLMAVFFYVVALEVKRETLLGRLQDKRAAAVPVAAAFGTMAGAASTYVAVNVVGGDLRGWAIPIATDIAFALGVLGLAGRRAPRELRAFLLTLAVVDDIGTIVVIAVFFTSDLSLAWLGAAVGVVVVIFVARRIHVRSLVPYVILSGALWLAVFESGVHATIAGIILGFLTPAVALHGRQQTGDAIGDQMKAIAKSDEEVSTSTLLEVSRLADEAVSPLAKREEELHPWTAYLILPLFALANAGVPVSLDGLGDAFRNQVGLGIILGLVVGAPIGGFLFAYLVVRLGPGRVPDGLDWPAIGAVTPLKGIGFTIAIFIVTLTFSDQDVQQRATLAVLIASAFAGLIGLGALYGRALFVGEDER